MSKRARTKRGHGAVRFHEGKYQAYVQIEGRRLWQSFAREADAWAWLATVKADAVRGLLKVEEEEKPSSVTFGDAARLLKLSKKAEWKPGTVQSFDGHMRASILPRLDRRPLAEITPMELQSLIVERRSQVSGQTVKNFCRIMGQVFRYAVRMRMMDENPMDRVDVPKAGASDQRCLQVHELRAILSSCPAPHRAFFTVLALTGLRRSEMFRLSWDWCDFENGMILVKEAKRGSSRVPMSERVKSELLRIGPKPEGRVFPGYARGSGKADRSDPHKILWNKTTALATVLEAAGIDPRGVGFHSFRRGFLSALDTVAPHGVCQALARHARSSVDITSRYTYATVEAQREALARLEDMLYGTSKVILFPSAKVA